MRERGKLIWINQIFLLLPYLFDLVALFLSTYVRMKGYTFEEDSVCKYYFNWAKLAYLVLVGFIFLFAYKSKGCYRAKDLYNSFPEECKLWFFSSLLFPAIPSIVALTQAYSDLAEVKEQTKTIVSLFFVLIQFVQFFIIYSYVKSSWIPIKTQFFSLYRDKSGKFDSSRLAFFVKKIFGILAIDIVIFFSVLRLINWILPSSLGEANPTQNENQSRIERLLETNPIVTSIQVLLIAPFIEEISYRRATLRISNFSRLSIFSSSLIFASLHIDSMQETFFHLLIYLFGGIIYGVAYKRFKNIWVVIFAHFLHNLSSLLFFLLLKEYG